ncbi:MAG: transposase [Bacteroidales bacterium]|nr:transposase [Bacteroidales bacterium]
MNLSKDKVTEIFYFADNFCKEFYKAIEIYAIEEGGKARREPRRKPKMSSGEVVTIMVLFHYGAFRNLKHFYLHYVCRHMRGEFPQTVSYNRFVELKDKILLRKRSVIETVNDELKTMCQIEHSRHRSFTNFLTNTLAAMIAYSFFPKKPAIKFEVETTNQLALF